MRCTYTLKNTPIQAQRGANNNTGQKSPPTRAFMLISVFYFLC